VWPEELVVKELKPMVNHYRSEMTGGFYPRAVRYPQNPEDGRPRKRWRLSFEQFLSTYLNTQDKENEEKYAAAKRY